MLALNKKRNQAGWWPEGHSNSKRLTVCSPPLINEGNYLGWESAHTCAAASPGGTLLLNLLRPPRKHTVPSLPLNSTHQYPVQLICKFGSGANLKDSVFRIMFNECIWANNLKSIGCDGPMFASYCISVLLRPRRTTYEMYLTCIVLYWCCTTIICNSMCYCY